jgi:hypothetical protein
MEFVCKCIQSLHLNEMIYKKIRSIKLKNTQRGKKEYCQTAGGEYKR